MKAKDGITSFSLKRNARGKNNAWPWLGEYCAEVILHKDFTHPNIGIPKKEVLPGLRADLKTALGKASLKPHWSSEFEEMALVVTPINAPFGGEYMGFRLTIEIDGPTETEIKALKMMGGKPPTLADISKLVRAALEQALDQ